MWAQASLFSPDLRDGAVQKWQKTLLQSDNSLLYIIICAPAGTFLLNIPHVFQIWLNMLYMYWVQFSPKQCKYFPFFQPDSNCHPRFLTSSSLLSSASIPIVNKAAVDILEPTMYEMRMKKGILIEICTYTNSINRK